MNYINCKFSLTYLIIVLMISGSCKNENPEQKQLNELHDEVMLIHDEVMPKMRDIYKIRRSLKKLEQTEEVMTLISNLENADDAMMDWMAQYKKPKTENKNYTGYLADQKQLIIAVRDQMLQAIESGSNYLSK